MEDTVVVEAEEHVEPVAEVEAAVEVVGVEANQEQYACTIMTTTVILVDMISIWIIQEQRAIRRAKTTKSQQLFTTTWGVPNVIATLCSDRDHRIMIKLTMY